MSLDTAGLRVLARAECLHLLRTVRVGRVAISHRALPMILPVHFRIADDDAIRIESAPGTTLHRATDHAVVAFEADGPAGSTEPTWSVIAHGVATHLGPIDRFVVGTRVGVAISIDEVSGREVLDIRDPMAPVVTSARARW